MPEGEPQLRPVRFGNFEADLRSGELRKAGVKLKLGGQPFQVLTVLLERPGEVVTREELQKRLWPDTYVDVDHNLNTAINKIREVLGDSAESPRFVETLPRRGYRFIAPVEGDFPKPEPQLVERPLPSPTPPVNPANKRRLWRTLAAITVAAVATLIGVALLSRPLPPPRITAFTQITHDGHAKYLGGTDGSRLYFTLFSPNSISQVGINGGEIAQLPIRLPGVRMTLMDISPDGSNALVSTVEEGNEANPQWVVPVLGGAAKRLDDGVGEAFSPDGGSVIYSTTNGDIFTVHIDGSDRHKLASVGSVAIQFKWSPNGKVIRFSKDDALWEMSPDGTGVHRMLPGWNRDHQCCGRWTGDGGLFVFKARGEIWALDERRSLFRRPSSAPIQLTSAPIDWSPPIPGKDGNRIFLGGYKRQGELSRIDPKTGAPQPFLDGISAETVSFSPDGNSVAYVAYPEGTLWKANRDGSNRMQLTSSSSNFVILPRWSPDSKQILFTTQDPDGHTAIHRISAADGSPQWLLPEETGDVNDPTWSPDGTKVVFATGSVDAPGKGGVRIVDLNTRHVTVVPGSVGKWSAHWSPDGRYIAALIHPQINHLFVFDLKLQRWSDLPVNGEVEFPTFSHDSRFIYFVRYEKDQGVFRIPVTGGKEERVADMSSWHLTGHFGFSMTLDPTDSPLVLRDTGSDDIYALTLEQK